MVAATAKSLQFGIHGLQQRANACRACDLCKERWQAVPGAGRVPSPLMFVGEAPGGAEDQKGQPFIGPSGQLFDSILDKLSIKRWQVYTTNVCKCRPPQNRTPTPREVRACSGFLLEEIAAVRPKVIVALGGTALRALGGAQATLTTSRGTLIQPTKTIAAIDPDIRILGTYHPAYAIRQESTSLKRAITEDIREAIRLVKEGYKPKALPKHRRTILTPGYTAEELSTALTALVGCNIIAADCEWTKATDRDIAWPWTPNAELFSISLSGWTDNHVTSVAFAWPPPRAAQHHLETFFGGSRFLFHNAQADLIWLQETGLSIDLAGDTMVLAYLLNEEQSLRLEPLAKTYAGLPEWKSSLWEQRPDTPEIWQQLLEYNSDDTYATLLLDDALYQRVHDLSEDERTAVGRLYYRLMLPAISLFVKIAHRGMPLDLGKVREAITTQDAKLNDLCDDMAARFTVIRTVKERHDDPVRDADGQEVRYKSGKRKGEVKTKLRVETQQEEVQAGRKDALTLANSPKRIKAFFRKEHHLNLPKTDKGVMSRLALEYPAADLIQQIKAVRKLLSTYLRPWAELLSESEDGRLHSVYSVTGSRTGRTTARTGKGGSVQLAPREHWLRQMFAVRPGRTLLVPDLSQIELRMISWLAPEMTMREVYRTGGDIHRLTAAFVKTGNPHPTTEELQSVTSDERYSAKRINFGYAYGMQPKRFVEQAWNEYRVVLSLDEATRQREAYFDLYNDLRRWHERCEQVDFRRGYSITPFGQKRHYLTTVEQAINAPIQTVGTQLAMLTMIELERIFTERPDLEAEIVGFIHDSIEIEGPDDPEKLAEIKAIVKQEMEHPPTWKLGVDEIPVPIEADVLSGPNWGDAEK